jgi:NNP family nitrate/nitrite transporter-like MFS transporter
MLAPTTTVLPLKQASKPARGRTLQTWDPEDAAFWQSAGRRVAQRNLWISVPALLLAFAVWMVWSAVVVKLPQVGFSFTENQLFWLTALPGLSGATLRIFYSFLVPILGGRNWTVISTLSLLLPAAGMGLAVQNPNTPYACFVGLALLAGLGGGNFASSMANISFFFPKKSKGTALGINAGLGNLGVSVMQALVPLVITTGALAFVFGGAQPVVAKTGIEQVGQSLYLQNAGYIWIPFILIASVAAFFGMNNLATAKASFRDQAVIFRRADNWIMCWLYMGTFGSFIGFSAAFPMLIKTQFAGVNPLAFAFMGPLVGALVRPVGGWLADKFGGARVTFWNFVAMSFALVGVLLALRAGHFGTFLTLFILLFATTGIGNGSTFRMIPIIFLTLHQRRLGADPGQAAEITRHAGKEAAAVVGFSSAIAAYGMFFIPKLMGFSRTTYGSLQPALLVFLAFYLTCIGITWYCYSRRNAKTPC